MPATRSATASIAIRPLSEHEEYSACVQLQREIWGVMYDQSVPARFFKIVQLVGGIALGAFDGEALVGFVFGLTGMKDGRLVHWSDMLAVLPRYRGGGLGQRLKHEQRRQLRRIGVERMLWTYDPLESRNGHLNINRLGARVVDYIEDMYGASESTLHQGIGTDRFVVEWDLTAPDSGAGAGPPPAGHAPVVNPAPHPGLDAVPAVGELPLAPLVRVEVPAVIQDVKDAAAEAGAAWRATTRQAFQFYRGRGYEVTGLSQGPEAGRYFYHLQPTRPT